MIMEDPDVAGAKPLTHWILGDLPGSTKSLAEGAVKPKGAFETGGHGTAGDQEDLPPLLPEHGHLLDQRHEPAERE